METISHIVVYGVVALASIICGVWTVRWLHQKFRAEAQPEEELDLSSADTRARLKRMIDKYGITGSADIREGLVLEPIDLSAAEPLTIVLANATAFIGRLQNPAASSLYVRDSVNDRFMLLSDLDLDHLIDAHRIMQEIARGR